ncbi:glycosyltransferase family 1 protein [Crepidotus variabilis]|uniref:Glycosyltransferase family 1 protein n=1 Tax=Crepidotus variabilis TaxID=179855 RepID=A0A9P6EQQ7_9AGAR|nr:glycosyltransferase family 1 protein [Crepidotus variabilis]
MNITSKQNELDSSRFTEHLIEGRGLDSIASIGPDGKISLRLDLKELAKEVPDDHAANVIEFATDFKWRECPSLSILIMIVGSRGDVQPYLALGQQLKKDGHRVRLATHETFREIVVDAGLEFFCIGGNPQDLMSYMVKNPGLMPGFESLTNGDIVRKRKMLTEMINGCWRACHKPAEDGPFVADAIISNPPSFAHVHCAEALGIPLLLSFSEDTIFSSPTTSFPHPLVNVSSANAGSWTTNIMSYAASEMMQWQGFGDLVNEFRTTTLGLAPLSLRLGAGLVDRLKIPWTYCMSPALVPKPGDWKNFIDVVGFYFLDLGTKYTPKEDLAAFLKAGEPPVYIGFGSVVVDNPEAMTQIIFEATKQAGVRALVSAGWGGLGGTTIPSHVFILGNVPHDWLFDQDRVAAVVHHGGAGTTAIGLAKGRPTVVVPFFGDQGFWGTMIHKAGAGPEPIPQKDLNIEILRDAITYAISPPAKEAAARLSRKILSEDGARKGAESFYRHLPLLNMRCDLDPTKVAIWWSQEHFMKLSSLAAQVLVDAKIITMDSLTIHRTLQFRLSHFD